MRLQQVAIVTVLPIGAIAVFPDAVVTVSGRSMSDEATNDGDGDGDSSISAAHRRRMDVLSPHFPAEGIDYLSGNRAGVIFDMSKTDGTDVTLTTGVSVPRPTSIASVKPSSTFEVTSETSTEMNLEEVSSSIASSYSNQWSLSIPVAKRIDAEVGGSRDAAARWARARMTAAHRYAVSSKFAYDFVEVTTKPPRNADLSEELLRAFVVLPSSPGGWDSLTDADRGAYAGFLETYGTHYVRSAKFGGSYKSLVVAEACATVLSSEEGSSLAACASAKLSLIFSEILGIEGDITSSEMCQGLTTSGAATDAWESSSVKSTQLWWGGSFDGTESLKFDDVGAWIEDVKRNPRSRPTQLASVPDLFRELLGAYDLGGEFCLPCQTLKGFNLDKETFRIILRNLDFAFNELLERAKEEKLEGEECKLTCGNCGKGKPLEGCTCPKPTATECSGAGENLVEVTIESIHMEVERQWISPFAAQNLRLFTTGLDSPYDGKEYFGKGRSVSVDVGTALLRKRGDTIFIEVIDDPLQVGLKNCVGSVDFPLDQVGSENAVSLNGSCTRDNNSMNTGRVGKNPKVRIEGSFKLPNCCTCDVKENSAGGHCASLFWLFLSIFLSWPL